MTLETFFDVTNPVKDPLWTDIADMIRHKAVSHPRHLQVELGPSEVGTPCMRKIAYGMMQAPRCNPDYDPLPSIFGIAFHNWAEGAAAMANELLGRERWLTETRVEVTPGLSGSADLYDTDTATVIDYKALGYTSFPTYVKDIGPTYRHQVHMYGRGFKRLGYDVKRVAVCILPRTGTLTKMHLAMEDYDDALVDGVLARRDAVMAMLDEFNVDVDSDRFKWIPATPDKCVFCSWFTPNARNGFQCNGKA